METGKVKFFSVNKGFGFISDDNSDADFFVHSSNLQGEVINKGDKVQFEIKQRPDGREMAVNVKKI